MNPQVVGTIVSSIQLFYAVFAVFWFWHLFRGGTLSLHRFIGLCCVDLIYAFAALDDLSNKVNRDTFYRESNRRK